MSTSLDEQEAELVRKFAGQERRSESSMLRLLVCESLDRRSAGGDGGWTASARRAPAKEQHALSGAVPAMRDDAVRPPDLNSRLPTPPRDHGFRPQKTNALKCETCGGKAGEHRG